MTQGKTLYRSRDEQMLGGVCAGIADYLGIDPTVIRLATVLLLVIGNAAVLVAYVVLWAVVPESPRAVQAAVEGVSAVGVPVAGQGSVAGPARPGPGDPPPPPPPAAGPPPPPPSGSSTTATRSRGPLWLGVALIFVGLVLLVQMFVPGLVLWQFWPVVIIVAGVLIVFRRGR